ncbi:MAG: hypothetical protein ACREDR_24330, partial [Blastocatellia bacterium]
MGPESKWVERVDRLGRSLRLLQIEDSKMLLGEMRAEIHAVLQRKEQSETQTLRALIGDDSAKLLVYFGLAVDFDAEYASTLRILVAEFEQTDKGSLRLHTLACLGLAGGLIEFFNQSYNSALGCFNEAERDVSRAGDRELMVITGYYLARCHWRLHDYETAIRFAARAREQEEAIEGSKRAALIQLLQGYLELLRGKYDESSRLLEMAEGILRETDDYLSLGNAISFRGQRLRRMGLYQEAINAFEEAKDVFEDHAPNHRNWARCLANNAVALRLQAQKMPKRNAGTSDSDYRRLVIETAQWLRADAQRDLDKALRIYRGDERGIAKCRYTRALCRLDEYRLMEEYKLTAKDLDEHERSGNDKNDDKDKVLHKAESDAKEAYRLGAKLHDDLVSARAAITLCQIQLVTPKANGVK